jgi:hypothetical protein
MLLHNTYNNCENWQCYNIFKPKYNQIEYKRARKLMYLCYDLIIFVSFKLAILTLIRLQSQTIIFNY